MAFHVPQHSSQTDVRHAKLRHDEQMKPWRDKFEIWTVQTHAFEKHNKSLSNLNSFVVYLIDRKHHIDLPQHPLPIIEGSSRFIHPGSETFTLPEMPECSMKNEFLNTLRYEFCVAHGYVWGNRIYHVYRSKLGAILW